MSCEAGDRVSMQLCRPRSVKIGTSHVAVLMQTMLVFIVQSVVHGRAHDDAVEYVITEAWRDHMFHPPSKLQGGNVMP